MSKHTPGPWVAQRGGDISFVRTVDGGIIDRIVASHANAILIAAAPDLLEALEKLVGSCPPLGPWDEEDWGSPSNDAMAVAAAAIAKAKGDDA